MGASHSLEFYEDQDSVAEPGTKSIISASMDDLDPPVTGEEFFSEFDRIARSPIDPTVEAVVKKVDVKEHGPGDFTVMVVLDGKKLDGYGYGRGDGMDKIRNWKRVTLDRTKRMVVTLDYVDELRGGTWADEASDASVYGQTVLHELPDPTRIEICVDKDGERLTDVSLRDALYGWTDQIVGGVQGSKTAKVRVSSGTSSIKDKGAVSDVSEPMDMHVDYDGFFTSFVAVIKKSMTDAPGSKVEDISGTEFAGEGTAGHEGTEKLIRTVVKFMQDTGDIEIVTFQDGVVTRATHYKLHQSPLVLESWGLEPDGTRISTPATARALQVAANAAIDKANSWFG